MANKKLSVPSVVALNSDNMPYGTLVFLQAVEDALKKIDDNVVYKDSITVPTATATIKAVSAQGQAFSVSGINLASGDDYAVLTSDVKALLQSHLQLQQQFDNLVKQLQGN